MGVSAVNSNKLLYGEDFMRVGNGLNEQGVHFTGDSGSGGGKESLSKKGKKKMVSAVMQRRDDIDRQKRMETYDQAQNKADGESDHDRDTKDYAEMKLDLKIKFKKRTAASMYDRGPGSIYNFNSPPGIAAGKTNIMLPSPSSVLRGRSAPGSSRAPSSGSGSDELSPVTACLREVRVEEARNRRAMGRF